MPNYYDQMQPPPDFPINGPPSFGQRFAQGARGLMGNQDLAMALLANSGYSPQKRSFGEIMGTSMLQANQMKQSREDDAFKRQYMQAQMQAMGGKPMAVMGPDGKPVYVREQDAVGQTPFGQSTGGGIGAFQPGDYTPESFAKYMKSNNVADLVRYVPPRQETSKPFQNVIRTFADGSTQSGAFDTRTGEWQPAGPVVPAGTKPRVDARGKAEGEASGGQDAKAPAKASMDYVIGQFRNQLLAAPQGGLFGYKGKAGTVTSKADTERFDNLREQLSTELRTAFRIPGEGTLSDAEQKQYGIQLPSTNYEPENNAKILDDIEARTGLRLSTPVGGQSQGPAPVAGKETAAQRAKRLGL